VEPELFRALGALSETPRPDLQPIADLLDLGPLPGRAAHGELFLFQLYPYASVYLGAEGMMGGEAADRIAGFWRALGQTPPAEPDHIAVMLGLHARLGELEEQAADPPARARWRHARAAFLWEHLLCWLPIFLLKLGDLGGIDGSGRPPRAIGVSGQAPPAPPAGVAGESGVADPFYRRWAALLGDALRAEAAVLPLPEGPERLPLHLRAAPAGIDPRRDGPEGFLASLLSPARTGMVLARADLARAARELELGLRLGERRLMLRAMLEQDAGPVLGWLAGEAASWAGRHLPAVHLSPSLAACWHERAAATARLLRELQAEI
jgi:Nitrate reductase delta subunit